MDYEQLLKKVYKHGTPKQDRTGTGTLSLFGEMIEYDVSKSFPLITTKKVHWKSVLHELLWFVSGETNIRPLVLDNVKIWNEWPYEVYKKSKHYKGESLQGFILKIIKDADFAKKHGDLGPVYGKQWRDFGGIDQLSTIVNHIKENPNSRRHIVSAWNPPQIDKMALPPCHMMYQFYVDGGKLSLMLYQRSADIFLGVPFNIASYAALLYMVAKLTNLAPKTLKITFGDVHLYKDHLEQAKTQLGRKKRKFPVLIISGDQQTIDDFKYKDFELINYKPHSHIPGKVSV